MRKSKQWLLIAIGALSLGTSAFDRSALAGNPVNQLGRIVGVGWSDGYHACKVDTYRIGENCHHIAMLKVVCLVAVISDTFISINRKLQRLHSAVHTATVQASAAINTRRRSPARFRIGSRAINNMVRIGTAMSSRI